MFRITLIAALIAAPFTATAQDDQTVEPAVQEQITAMLADMQCEVDAANIEPEENGGYELDDVFCADGQYDIELDEQLQVVEKRKE